MKHPALISEKNSSLTNRPILIVDKKGEIGSLLVNELKEEGIIVFVSKKQLELNQTTDNIIHVPFLKRIPLIPENNYSYIFIIDDNDVLRESISSFLKKAELDKSTLIFITSLFELDEKLIIKIKDYYKNTKIIIHGEVINLISNENLISPANKLIYEARKYGRIEVPGDGTGLIYPIFIEDLIKGIIESTFGTHEEKIFKLFLEQGITYLSFAHMLQKNNPFIKVDFAKSKKTKDPKLLSEKGNISVAKNINLEEKLRSIFIDENKLLLEKKLIKKDKKKRMEDKKIGIFPYLFILFCLAVLLMMPFLSVSSLSILGAALLKDSKSNFLKGNIKTAINQAKIADKSFSYALFSMQPLNYQLSLVKKENLTQGFFEKILSGKNISNAAVSFFTASDIFTKVLEGNTKTPEEDFINGINLTKNTISILQKEKNNQMLIEDFDNNLIMSLNFISSTIDLWPELMGFNEEKKYLLLLQNNMELRPAGGFIGSYAILTIIKGKIVSFQINDVYDADGKLNAHIEPQFALRRHLSVKHLFLRDSNFDMDFRKTASTSALLLNLETEEKVNGVIGINLNFVKNILDAIGEVEVVDYKEKVNSENLFYVTESHVEKGFFPGSTQKKDFLRSLYKAIITKLTQEKNIQYQKLLNGLVSSIEQKNIIFAFNNPSVQNLFTVNRWSSALWDERKNAKETVNDFIGINESNLGGNKVNYFISRSVSQRVEITKEGEIKEGLTVLYKNTSDGKWPGGDYKNYLRLALPLGSEIEEIIIDGKKQKIENAITDPVIYESKNFKTPDGLELERTTESNKTIYGFLVLVPKESLIKIEIKYTLGQKIDLENQVINYNLRIFKQPGIENIPYDLIISFPEDYKVLRKSDLLKKNGEKEVFEENITKDKDLELILVKQ